MDYQSLNLDPDIIKKVFDGDPIAQVTLGKAWFNAVYVKNNCLNAFEWFSRAAEVGNMEAQFRLAELYALGQGTKQSHTDAHKWYTKAALQGYKKALVRIHNLYEQDKKMHCRGKLTSEEELRWWDYRELYEQRLGDHELVLNNTIEHFTQQLKKYQSCNQEDANVQLNLAFLYQHGYGVKKYTMRALELYTKAAEQGHRDAQYNAAYLYHITTDIKFNYRHALRWYRASATNGNIVAQNYLAYFYEKGLATDVNWEGALYWYTKSANAGNSNAQLTLGKLYRKGEVVEQNFLKAAKWYKLSASQGNNAAKNCLEQLYQSGKLDYASDTASMLENELAIPTKFTLCSKLQKDIAMLNDFPGIKQLKALAMHALMTDGNAMYRIGLNYFNGEELPLDKDTGYQWIKRAAMTGLQEAVLKVAKMHKEGDTVQQDYHTSGVWTIKGARQKNSKAQYNLGLLYKEGLGVRRDPLEASKWFIKASDQNNSDARYEFGLLKYYGEGVRKDEDEAVKWFSMSALQGNPNALHILGEMYEVGGSLKKNESKAIRYYEGAAYFGCKSALFKLGKIYEEGELIQKNLSRAHEYYTMAADSGDPYYQYELGIKYINGVFDDPDYIKAFNLLKKAAERNHHDAKFIFQAPLVNMIDEKYCHSIIDMFILASRRGLEGVDYNLGYAYEYGIDRLSISPIIRKMFHIDFENALEWYRSAAKKGDSRAKYRLGVIYEEGKGVARDLEKAFDYYNQAYSNGNTDAMYNLGLMYLNGKGVSEDLVKAFYLFTEASNLGHEEARKALIPSTFSLGLKMLETVANLGIVAIQYQLGEFYRGEDDSKSFEWFNMAAEGGMIDAYYELGRLYEKGKGTYCDYSKVIAFYEKSTQKDHEEALYRLAELYIFGETIEHNYLRAYNLYSRAAKLDHREAFRFLNDTWDTTLNINETNQENIFDFSLNRLRKALSMLRFVAEDGSTDVQYQLGSFYERNEYNRNYSEAFKWYRLATHNNHVEAIYRLGLFYENGLGVKRDYNKAIHLYHQAKYQGSHDALYRLGVIFHHGYGVEVNHSKAIDFYEEAAALGNSQSQYTLGNLYETGDIVHKDVLKALTWYTKAYLNDYTSVIPELYNLYDHESYERFFHNKLFQILSKLENSYKSDNPEYYKSYGSIYYKLGKMYLDGIGTRKNNAKALMHFLKAYYNYLFEDVEPFITLNYEKSRYSDKSTFIEMLNTYEEIRDCIPSRHQYELGMLYYNGYSINETDSSISESTQIQIIVPKSNLIATQHFELVYEENFVDAQHQLGIINLEGDNIDQAIVCFSKAAESFDILECYSKGMNYYLEGRYEMSLSYLKVAATNNHAQALAQLGIMYIQGNGVEENVDEAMALIEKSLQQMRTNECYNQGMKFYQGSGVDINYDISLMYLQKAAVENNAYSQARLGYMYLNGIGVGKDDEQAKRWYDEIEYEDFRKPALEIGQVYHYNYDGIQNFSKALKYYQKQLSDGEWNHHSPYREDFCIGSANRGIGLLYEFGDGVDQDYKKALEYYKKSADSQNIGAFYNLGLLYYYGRGVEQNYKEAVTWFREIFKPGLYSFDMYIFIRDKDNELGALCVSANREYSLQSEYTIYGEAQYYLGLMYKNGYGVAQNDDRSQQCFENSFGSGIKRAENFMH